MLKYKYYCFILLTAIMPHTPLYATSHGLVVGIGKFGPNTSWTMCKGAQDAHLFSEYLKNEHISHTSLIDEAAVKERVIKELKFITSKIKIGDTVVFYYSGYGQKIEDYTGKELDGWHEALALYNAPRDYDRLYENEHHLMDDEFSEYFNQWRNKAGVNGMVLIVLNAEFYYQNQDQKKVRSGPALTSNPEHQPVYGHDLSYSDLDGMMPPIKTYAPSLILTPETVGILLQDDDDGCNFTKWMVQEVKPIAHFSTYLKQKEENERFEGIYDYSLKNAVSAEDVMRRQSLDFSERNTSLNQLLHINTVTDKK